MLIVNAAVQIHISYSQRVMHIYLDIRINQTMAAKLRQCKVLQTCPQLDLRITYASKDDDPVNQYAIVSAYGKVVLGEEGWFFHRFRCGLVNTVNLKEARVFLQNINANITTNVSIICVLTT